MHAASSRSFICALTLVFLLTAAGFAQSFQQTTYSSPNRPADVFVADLNRDGHPDIVTTQFTSNMVTVFLNHGNGTFTDGGSATYLVGSAPQRVVVADFNGDGNPDLAVGTCTFSTGNVVSVLFGNGDGTFQPRVDYPVSGCVFGFGFMRVAHDTALSLIVAMDSINFEILRNNGDGTFHSQTVNTPANISGISAADYNNDGIADIAGIEVANPNRVLIFPGNASGGFGAPQTIFTASPDMGLFTATTVDFNGDGRGDLLVPWDSPGSIRAGVVTLANNGTGKFTTTIKGLAPSFFLPAFKPSEGDFAQNGFHGIVLPATNSGGPDAVAFFPGIGKNAWDQPVYLSMGTNSSPESSAVGDFNGDGLLDFAVVTMADNTLHIFTNNSCALPPKAGIGVCSPTQGSTVASPVRISATANGVTRPITAMKAYIDGKQVASSRNNMLNASVPAAKGVRQLTINAWDSTGKLYQAKLTFTVH